MIRLDEDALICDLAETYHIYDYKAMPVSLVATLAAGLREGSRIRILTDARKAPVDTILLAGILDRLSVLLGGDQAKLIAKEFITSKQEPAYGFSSPEEFEAAWAS